MKIFCRDLKREINKRECLPDKSSDACKTCPEKIKSKNKSSLILKPKQIADVFLKNSKKLPIPLREWHEADVNSDIPKQRFFNINFVAINYKNFISKKNLNTLNKKYPKETIEQVFQSLLAFYSSFYMIEKTLPAFIEAKNINRKVKPAIRAIDILLDIEFFLDFGEFMCLKAIKKRLVKHIKRNPVIITPFEILDVAYRTTTERNLILESIPFRLNIGNPGQSLFKALQIVIYKLLDTGNDKKQTERIVADIINYFLKKYSDKKENQVTEEDLVFTRGNYYPTLKYRKLKFKKLTSKDINNALHSS